ncbi:MAG: biopolymer transporter ExbD [Candidatus Omnitrophota bacterium]
MRFKRKIRSFTGELGTIDIAPLIDVVFQLLIFFMLTSSFIFQPGIKVNLPKAITSEVIGEENIVITITAENLIYLEGAPVTLKELQAKLQPYVKKKTPLLIKADKRCSLGRVVEVWDTCRGLGLAQVNIATNQSIE